MKNHELSFADRLGAAAKAKQTQLKKAKANNPANKPGFAERQAARRAVSIAREVRLKDRKAAKEADKIRTAEEEEAKKLAKEIAFKA